jgi:putative MATE family efflux protein
VLKISPSPRVATILGDHDRAGRDALGPDLHRETFRSVTAMGLPSIASFLLLTIYDLVDIFWLAKVGEAPVAAVTIFGALLWVISFPNQIIGTGSVSIISRRFGAGEIERTELAIKNTFAGKFGIGIVMGAVGWILCGPALDLMGAEPNVRELGVAYGRIQFAVLAAAIASFSVYTAFRCIGRPQYGMWVSVVGAVVNLVLDPLLIFGIGPFPELGVVGASIASACGFFTVTLWGMVALASPGSPVRVRWLAAPWPSLAEIRRMAKIGLPSGIEGLSFSLFASVLVKLVATYGTTTVALFGMSRKVLQFGHMVIAGLGLGSGALVGQHLGARRLAHAWATAVVTTQIGTGTLLLFAVLVFGLAGPIVDVFFGDSALRADGVRYLRLLSLGLPFVGIWSAAEQAYTGAGRTIPPMIAQTISSWLITVPLMWTLGEVAGFGPGGMMLGLSIGQAVAAIIGLGMMRRGTWLLHEV